ncbi:glycosyltransferase family 4 protein [Rudanella lutea]|uniref:glycosyltransferase family 4 protein n=1 Tax=Rudanella lutea TaxID=451374 RepID=UPI00037A1D61|nr:glycosyltransferase family 1 protein [Rudanella lutea]
MNILYDHQAFTGHTYGGVARYFYDLLRCLSQEDGVRFDLSLLLSNSEYLANRPFANHFTFKPLAHNQRANQVASVLNRMNSIRHLRAGRFDVFHPTYYHRYFLDYIGKKPFVITFHDATSERYADQFPDVGQHLPELKKVLLNRADRIIAVSEFSRQEIERFFGIGPDRVDVVHLGTTLGEADTTGLQPLPYEYLLYVGKRPFYKNFDLFFKAIAPLLKRHPELHLVCAGGGSFTPGEQALFAAAGLSGQVHQHGITDASLLHLYQHARAFVFPSLNEGFGIPVLEAFSGKCPVLLSDRSSLPEVAGEAAVYFDPESEESMLAAVEGLVFNDARRAELTAMGTERLKLFSCEKTAHQTLQVYRELVP